VSSSYDSKELFNLSSLASKGYPQEAKLLLDTLFGEFTNCYIEMRLISKGRSPIQLFYPSMATIQWGLVKGKNLEGYDCYFGVCLRKAQKGDKSSVASISALWADVDAKNFSGGKPEVLAQLKKLPPYLFPSVIVDTGHGYHLYWLLRETEPIESPQDILRLEAYMKGLALTLHGDSTSDLSRVLRLPGLVNQKDAKNPCLCHIIHWEPEQRFTPIDFDDYQEEILKEAPEGKPKRAEEAKKWPQRSDEFNDLAIKKLLESCAFLQHCQEDAATLPEPWWWSMVHILAVFGEPGQGKIHELSKPYPGYTEKETDQKIEEALKAADKDVGPHTCLFIEQDLGFDCPENCLAKKLGTKSPAGLASKVATHAGFRNNGLPVIVVNNRQLRDITKDALTALYEANVLNPKIFTRGGNLIRVSIDEKQNPYIDPLTESALRGLLTRAADFVKVNINAKGEVGETEVSPPLDVVCDILSLREWQLPPLLSITEVPVIRSDGTIVNKIGYDATTCLYYYPSPELRVPPVPDTPTKNDAKVAKDLILEVICNFPFDSEASGGNAVAAMLTPIVRPMIDGLVPLAVFDKPQPGTGASLLADVIALIATGQTAGMLGGQRKEEEWRKAITTILLSGRSVIVIDNVDGLLYSTSLAAVLTARVWRDRILGRNEEVLLPNLGTWIANGNNIRLLGDLPRRAYRVRLDAQLAQPWLRRSSEFKHPDLIKWVKEKRGDIIAAMLTVARSWVVVGKPAPQDLVTIGSYESFCEVLGGILSFMEVKDFLKNLQQMYTEMDVETSQWENFLEAWQEVFGDSGVTVAEVTKYLNKNDGFAAALPDSLADKDAKGYSRKLGNALARRTDVRFPSGLTIQKGVLKQRAIAWEVTRAGSKLTGFSFRSELSELASTPRGCKNEKDNDNNNKSKWVHRNSPNSLLDTKSSELAKNNPDYPHEPCPTCGSIDYWLTPDEGWLCERCHPEPK